jgi:hypothetical protein
MKIWEVSFIVTTYFVTFSSIPKFSSTPYVFRAISFSSVSCISCFTFPCVAGNFPISLSALFCSGPKCCWMIFCQSRIFLISQYDFLYAKMVIIRSTGDRVFILSEAFCTLSCASRNSVSTYSIYGSSVKFVQIYALSSQRFVHSSSNALMFSTLVIVVLSLPALSSGGVPDVLHDCKS